MQDDSQQNWQQPPEAAPGIPVQQNNVYQGQVQPAAQQPTQQEPPIQEQPLVQLEPIESQNNQEALQTAQPISGQESGAQPNTQNTLLPTSSQTTASPQATELTSGVEDPEQEGDILVRWQSAEHLHEDRSVMWYGILAVITIALMALAYFLFHSLTFAILLPVMAVALAVYAHRPPDIIDYTLTKKGLYIRDKLYPYDQFKSFGIVSIDGVHHVELIPRKRFQVGQAVYFPEESGEEIVDMLAARLPMKDIKPDFVDKLLAKLHL